MLRTLLSLLFFLILLCTYVEANTEIKNFEASGQQEHLLPAADRWPVLRAAGNELTKGLTLASEQIVSQSGCAPSRDPLLWDPKKCPDEMWAILELDDDEWKKYSKFTLRASWPASSPADISIDLYTAGSILAWFPNSTLDDPTMVRTFVAVPSTRRKYARIFARPSTSRPPSADPEIVLISVILEPLLAGVLPRSVVPIVFVILLAVALAFVVAPWINRYLEGVANKAREEIRRDRKD